MGVLRLLFLGLVLLPAGCGGVAGTPHVGASGTCPVPADRRPVAAVERVLIVSVDGLRPDLLLRADAPRMRKLMNSGTYTFWAEAATEAYTLPCHVSMLTGFSSKHHGVTWNDYIEESYPNVPTLFEVAKRAGYTTALVTGKMKFITLTKPNTLDHRFLPAHEPYGDHEVALRAAGMIKQWRPQVLFVHLPGVDTAGHETGWGSPEQVHAVGRADRALGVVLDALRDARLAGSTLVILTADHGGSGRDHGSDDPCSRYVPWIASGPGVQENLDLTTIGGRRVKTEDTFATACAFLGINPGKGCEGRPVLQAIRRSRLITEGSKPGESCRAADRPAEGYARRPSPRSHSHADRPPVTLRPAPNPVPLGPKGKGTVTIRWDTRDDTPEKLFACELTNQDDTRIDKDEY